MTLKEDDVVFCTVKQVEKANVFVDIDGDSRPGTIIMSEIAAGRIRNIREYVFPGRKIVCKVLRIKSDHVELSLRRVTAKEKNNVVDAYKKEKALENILKSVGEDAKKVIEKIKEEYSLVDFFEEARENPEVFGEFLNSGEAEKVAKMFAEKSAKDRKVERKFKLESKRGEGVRELKEILDFPDVGIEIHYLGSGVFSVSVKGRDLKKADMKLDEVFVEIEKRAKAKKAEFEVKKK